jgi:hypothetical protein
MLHGLLHHSPQDFTPAPAPSSPSRHAPSAHQRLLLRAVPAVRRVTNKRPSWRQPTTYITADPASGRRMVHQVTGADDLPALPRQPELLRLTRCRCWTPRSSWRWRAAASRPRTRGIILSSELPLSAPVLSLSRYRSSNRFQTTDQHAAAC